jgi:RecB family endonuclease NucS
LDFRLRRHAGEAGCGVRYLVQKPDGRFVMKLTLGGVSPPTIYTMSTPDTLDAHDFGSRADAEAWIRSNGVGKVAEITAEGYWPVEE